MFSTAWEIAWEILLHGAIGSYSPTRGCTIFVGLYCIPFVCFFLVCRVLDVYLFLYIEAIIEVDCN